MKSLHEWASEAPENGDPMEAEYTRASTPTESGELEYPEFRATMLWTDEGGEGETPNETRRETETGTEPRDILKRRLDANAANASTPVLLYPLYQSIRVGPSPVPVPTQETHA